MESAFYDFSRSFPNGSIVPILDDRHSTLSLTDEAISLMRSHSSSASPLFLYLAYTAAHTPLQAEEKWIKKCEHLSNSVRRDFCGLVVGVDEAVEQLTSAARTHLGDNVIFAFVSDNGGNSLPLSLCL